MPRSEKSIDTTDNALNAAQVLFSLNPAYAPGARHLWQVQEQFLRAAEKFSSAWFRRRHEATRSALELAAQIASRGMQDPAATMKAMTEWQGRSLQRLGEDAKDCADFVTRCTGSLIVNEIEAVEEAAEETKRAMAAKHATPV